MKVIVQIPCFNEERSLAQTIAAIPRQIPGVDSVEILIIDDGSTDATAEMASRCAADHLVRHTCNRGLARAFSSGIDASLKAGADIIVNTDGDNQYHGAAIPALVRPLLEGKADIVVGDRGLARARQPQWLRRMLQRLGSAAVHSLSGVTIPDVVSGFRALTRDTALKLNITSNFSYTIEMLLQAGQQRLAVVSVPVPVNPPTRESRLFHSALHFVVQSLVILIRTYTMYRPLRVFGFLGLSLLVLGSIPVGRFLLFYLMGVGTGHIQSLVIGTAALVLGFLALLGGVIADLIARNRALIEIALERIKRIELTQESATGALVSPILRRQR